MKHFHHLDGLIEKIREPIETLMHEASQAVVNRAHKYWYPLSKPSYDSEEILAAIDSLCSFRTTMAEKTAEFERQFTKSFGGTEAIMVNSGSSADLLIAFSLINMRTRQLKPGDEILIPSVTWPTQIWSLMMAGLKVRFVDTDPRTLNMDMDDLEAKIRSSTRGISLVHLMGNPCNMDCVLSICRKHDLILIEDCCEALGARFKKQPVGTFGIAGSFSFFFSHHITTLEGGMIICQDQQFSDQLRLLRAHGWGRNTKYSYTTLEKGFDPRYTFWSWGFNVRPTELQAGFGLEQILRWPTFHSQRLSNVAYLRQYFDQHKDFMYLMEVSPDAECSWFALPVMLAKGCPFQKNDLLAHLEMEGVETRPIVAGNLARQPVCRQYAELQDNSLIGADEVHDRGFYIGLHPFDSKRDLDRLVETFELFVQRFR